jgi:leader peptidase (prepilin peptidase)/N-methyltransferase
MTVLIFIIGLVFGSFLSVVFSRLEVSDETRNKRRKKKHTLSEVLFGRSRCDHCRRQIAWHDNIPLISFIALRGRCRHCRKPISHYHPVLELSAGLLLAAAFLFYGLSSQFFVAAGFGLMLLLVFAYDLKHQIIPNAVIIPGLIIALVLIGIQFLLFHGHPHAQLTLWSANPVSNLIGGAVAGGFFFLLLLLSGGRWVGGGDFKLATLIGLLLGWPYVLVALILAYLIGTAAAIALLATRHANLQSMLPFGPMLVMGWLIALFYGDQVIQWYQGWFL